MRRLGLLLLIGCIAVPGFGEAFAEDTDRSPLVWQGARASVGTTVYFADAIWTGSGAPIADAGLIVRNGKVVDVRPAAKIDLQAGWKAVSLPGRTLMPGMVIAETRLVESGEEERTLAPEIRAVDGFDFFADRQRLLAAGITTVQVSAGQDRLLPGQGAVVKLDGDDFRRRTLRAAETLRIQLTQSAFDAPTIYEPPVAAVSVERPLTATRLQVANDLSSAVRAIRQLWEATAAVDAIEDEEERLLVETIAGFAPPNAETVRVTARSIPEIRATIALMDELNQPYILVSPTLNPAWIERAANSESLRGVILESPVIPGRWFAKPDPAADEGNQVSMSEMFALLGERFGDEIPVGLKASSDADLEDIRFLTGLLGKDTDLAAAAVAAVTSHGAKLIGVADRVGSLRKGRHADFVVLSGDPLAPSTRVLDTYIEGRLRFSASSRRGRTTVISGATLHAPNGPIRAGSITVAGSKIRSVGPSASVPLDANVVSLPGAHVTAGLIDGGTKLGLGGSPNSRVALGDHLGEYLLSDDDAVRRGRAGGLVAGLLSSDRLPSPVVAFKLSDDPEVIRDPVALRYELKGNPTAAKKTLQSTLAGAKKYVDAWNAYDRKMTAYKEALKKYEAEKKQYDEEVAKRKKAEEEKKKAASEDAKQGKAKDSDQDSGDSDASDAKPKSDQDDKSKSSRSDEDAQDDAEKSADKKGGSSDDSKGSDQPKPPTKPTPPKAPRKVSKWEPFRAVFAKKIPLIIEVRDAPGVKLTLEIAKQEYGLDLVLGASGSAYEAAAEIAAAEVPVLVGTPLVIATTEGPVNLFGAFRTAGCRVLFRTDVGVQAASLPVVLAHAVTRGVSGDEILRAMTSEMADVMHLPSMGQLLPGYDADLTVFDGPPFHPGSEVIGVMIEGRWAYLDRRYRNMVGTTESNE